MFTNIPENLKNRCANDDDGDKEDVENECDCKNEKKGGEANEIRNEYKIEYPITFNY